MDMGLIQLSHWASGSQGNSQTTQAVAKTEDCSPQTDNGVPLSRTVLTQLIEHQQVELMLSCNPHPYVLVPWVWESTLKSTERERRTPTQLQNLLPTICPDCKICYAIVAKNLWN